MRIKTQNEAHPPKNLNISKNPDDNKRNHPGRSYQHPNKRKTKARNKIVGRDGWRVYEACLRMRQELEKKKERERERDGKEQQ